MHAMHLASMDLNLLVALSALVSEEHVTRAGARIGLSQSAMSHALTRLRDTFDDPILVRARDKMVATERARTLALEVDEALALLSQAVERGPRFDPKTARRTFTIAMSDYAELVVLPPLLARLRHEAPGIDLWVIAVPEDLGGELARGKLDMAIQPRHAGETGLRQSPLFTERFVCVFREGHALDGARLTPQRYAAAPHLLVAPGGQRGSFVDTALAEIGLTRRVVLAVPHFLVVPYLVTSSDLIVTLAERVTQTFSPAYALRAVPPPIKVPDFEMAQIWHARADTDAGHAWLRSVLTEVSATIGARDASRARGARAQAPRSSRAKRAPR